MLISLIFGLILGGITVIFALQNVGTITVTFLAWKIDGSLALILLAAALSGALMCALMSIPEIIRDRIRFTALKKQNRDLQKIVDDQSSILSELQGRVSDSSMQSKVIF